MDLNLFVITRNDLSLNITKFKQITFTGSQKYIWFNYNGNPFIIVDHFKDLGDIFYSKFVFYKHIIAYIKSKGLFKIITLRTIYLSYVRSILEYS